MDKTVILPPAVIGIIGGGQLGRMMAISARQMGYGIAALEPGKNSPLAQISDMEINRPYDDVSALDQLTRLADVLTYEFENIPAKTIENLEELAKIPQGARPLAISQHRLVEKKAINECGFKTAPFEEVSDEAQFKKALSIIGYPSILKTCQGGYDGKGQWALHSAEDVAKVTEIVGKIPCVLEGFVDFEMEISVIVTRSRNGEIQTFPAIENIHNNHILHLSIVPARIPSTLAQLAEQTAKSLIEGLGFVGTLAIEMFVVGDEVIINEMAPRPHNSGHLTIDAFNVSQFDQHIRAICGLPLLKPELKSPAVMVNLLGQHVDYTLDMWQQPKFAEGFLHLYGKEENKKDRKVGHITFTNESMEDVLSLTEDFLAGFPQ